MKTRDETRITCIVTGDTQSQLLQFDRPVKGYVSKAAIQARRSAIVSIKPDGKHVIKVLVGPLGEELKDKLRGADDES